VNVRRENENVGSSVYRDLLNRPLGNLLGRLLLLHRPVPRRTEEEVEAEVWRNYRWNFWVNLLDGVAFWFGGSFISASTILTLYVTKLTESSLPVGVIAVISQAGWFLPQLLTAHSVEQLARKKPVVVNLGFFLERLPVWVMALSVLLVPWSPVAGLVAFLLAYAWHTMGAGTVATAWQDMIAATFPLTRRGRFFGLTNAVGNGMGLLGAALSARILASSPFPRQFFYLFLIAAGSITVSWFFLSLTREPVRPPKAGRASLHEFWRSLPDILRGDDNFRRYLIARSLIAVGRMGSGFVTVAAVARWAIPDATVGFYTTLLLTGQTASNLAFGFLADRFGHKGNLAVGALASCAAFAIAWLAPAPEWYYGVFVLQGVVVGAIIVSGLMIVLEFCEAERRPTYSGLANTVTGVVSLVAPLVGALLAEVGYGVLFAASAAFSLLAFALMWGWVREPRSLNGET
jgi:MFS family permease